MKDLTHRQAMAIVTQAVIAAVVSVIGIYVLTEDLVAGVLVGALISAGVFAVNMFLSRNDKREIIESQEKLSDGLKEELKGVSGRLETMESLLREMRDEMRQMRIEMARLADAVERLGGAGNPQEGGRQPD